MPADRPFSAAPSTESSLRGEIANLEDALAGALNDYQTEKDCADGLERRFLLLAEGMEQCFRVLAEVRSDGPVSSAAERSDR